jgi:hypothetical protein
LTAASYPDGQLYVDLRGADGAALDTGEVLARFLRACGMDSSAIPRDAGERAETYRGSLAGRRVLVVLDNAATEEQIRLLLPGSPSCAVLITSRAPLAGIEGAHWIRPDVFAAREAIELLGRVADRERVVAEHRDAAEIVRLCGLLPLAVRVVAARLNARPSWRLADLVIGLRDQRRRLDQLAAGDLDVRACLAHSYHLLDEPARRLLRMLGLFDVPDFPGWLAGAVLNSSVEHGVSQAELLVDAHLLASAGTDPAGQRRYRFHELVRLFACERGDIEDTEAARAAAYSRGCAVRPGTAVAPAPTCPGATVVRLALVPTKVG